MKKFIAVFLLFLGVSPVFSQEDLMKKYAAEIDQAEMKDVLSILASDALEGRETGKRGQKMAAAFIADYFQEVGLTPVVPTADGMSYYQKFELASSKPGAAYLKLNDQTFTSGRDVLYYGTANMTSPEKAQAVFAGKGSDEEFATVKVKDNIVVVDAGDGSVRDWRAIQSKAYEKGAALVLIIARPTDNEFRNMASQYLEYFMHPKLGFKDQMFSKNNGAFLIAPSTAAILLNSTPEKMALAMEEKNIEKIKGGTIEFFSSREIESIQTENIMGYLEGADKKDEYVVITAHYDHIGRNGDDINNGADDDGSGTTSVLKIAKVFAQAKKDGHGPRRSMLFITFTGEELGKLGSEYYTNNPILPLDNTVVDLNIDMIGRTDEEHKDNREFVYLVGADKLSSELHQISEKTNEQFTHLSLDYTYNNEAHPSRIYYRSDHWNFAKNNIPVIFYFNGTHKDYHRPTDTVDKIEFDLLQKRAQLVFYTAWIIANRDNRLVVDKPQQENVGQH